MIFFLDLASNLETLPRSQKRLGVRKSAKRIPKVRKIQKNPCGNQNRLKLFVPEAALVENFFELLGQFEPSICKKVQLQIAKCVLVSHYENSSSSQITAACMTSFALVCK
jgi:hypothetical protein